MPQGGARGYFTKVETARDMVIGAAKVVLHLPANHSLKGKRQVVRSIVERVKGKFDVAIAEVDGQDLWQRAVLGIACVTNEAQHADEILSHVVGFIRTSRAEAEVTDYETEILHL